jgi:tripartite-type tricarboxylate transporter receptor subunit TctC
MRWISKFLPCFLAFAVTTVAAGANSYPERAIRIIVPFPPGGGTDTVARVVAAKLTER